MDFTLEELGVEFVIRASRTRKVQRFIADHDEDTFVTDYEMARSNPPTGRTAVRLVVVPHRSREDDHFCLVTNREVTSDVAQPPAEAYRRRWGIEILFAVALYNLWVLTSLFREFLGPIPDG